MRGDTLCYSDTGENMVWSIHADVAKGMVKVVSAIMYLSREREECMTI